MESLSLSLSPYLPPSPPSLPPPPLPPPSPLPLPLSLPLSLSGLLTLSLLLVFIVILLSAEGPLDTKAEDVAAKTYIPSLHGFRYQIKQALTATTSDSTSTS